MTGTSLDFSKHCKLPFVAYAEAHKEYTQTNTMAPRTRGVICIGPTGNFQGSYKMMCHKTGRKLTQKKFQELPMPDSIIKRIEAIAEKEKQENILVFSNRNEGPLKDDDETNDDITAGVDDNDQDDDDTNDNNNPPGILLDELVDNEDSEEEIEVNNESTGVPAESTGVHLLDELVDNEDSEEEIEVNNESTGVPAESTGVHDSDSTGLHDSESTGVHENESTGVPNDIANNTNYNESTGVHNEIADNATGNQEASVTETITDPTEGPIQVNTNEEEEYKVDPNVAPYNPDTWTPSIQRVHGLRPP
jgi:hypothetical protein